MVNNECFKIKITKRNGERFWILAPCYKNEFKMKPALAANKSWATLSRSHSMFHHQYHFHVVFIQLFKPLRNYLSSPTLILMGFAIRSSLLRFKGLNFGTKHLCNVLDISTYIIKIIISNRTPFITRVNIYLTELYCGYAEYKQKNLVLHFLN